MNKKKASKLPVRIIIILILLIAIFIFPKLAIAGKAIFLQSKNKSQHENTKMIKILLTKETLPLFLQSQQIVQDLPKNANIELKLYNTDNGAKNWEESYTITKANVKKGEASNPDAVVFIHSKYINKLADFCSAMKEAKNNGDLGNELGGMSKAGFLWKYKGLLKYKSCFGI